MAAQQKPVDRRNAIRYPAKAKASIRRSNGEVIQVTAVDISSSGMRLHFGLDCPLDLGEEVTVEVELPEGPDRSFSAWGVGEVAYVHAEVAGIRLRCGEFENPDDGRLQ